MKRCIWIGLIVLVCSFGWLACAAPQSNVYTSSCTGVLDRFEEGWATIQTDSGQDWLLPLTDDNLTEGGVFRITITMSLDDQLHKTGQAKITRLLLALLQ